MRTWVNYHHLLYFWVIAEERSITAAASKLKLTQPTLSSQLKQLEETLGYKLFQRNGRSLSLTSKGKIAHEYATTIFNLGREMQATLEGELGSSATLFRIGVVDSLPKFIVQRTLSPLILDNPQYLVQCFEGKREDLFTRLGAHELDLVISDAPFSSEVAVRAYNHRLGTSLISLYSHPKLARTMRGKGVDRFRKVPFLLPTRNTMMRRALDAWFEQNAISPKVVAEFEDSALLKAFGSEGHGVFPIASAIEKDVENAFEVQRVSRLKGVKEEFFAISLERRVTHPAIITITTSARKRFG